MKAKKIVLFIYLVLLYIGATQYFHSHFIGAHVDQMIFYLYYGSICLVPILLYFYGANVLSNFFKADLYLLVIFLIFILYLTILGIFNFDNRVTTLEDVYTFNMMVPMILLGSSKEFWSDFIRFSFILIFFALIINIISSVTISKSYHFQEDTLSELEDTGTVRLVRQILAYRTERAMALWPLFLFLLPKFNKRKSAIVILMVMFMIALQILFQKRGPIIRVLTYIFSFLVILPILIEQSKRIKIRRVQYAIGVLVIVVGLAGAISYLPEGFLGNQVEGLIERFEGRRFNNQSYKGGALAVFTTENERIAEVIHMFKQMHFTESLFGKGLGGTYFNTLEFNKQMAGTHIGIFSLVLKGGIFLFLLYHFILFRIFANFSLYRKNYFALSCAIIIFIIHLFFWQEAFMFFSAQSIRLMFTFMAIGYLLSYKKRMIINKENWAPI